MKQCNCFHSGKCHYVLFSTKASLSMITVLILLAASFVVLIAFEAPLLAKLLSFEKQEHCEATVAVHKATKLFDILDSPVPIVCPRTQVDFYRDHVEIDQKKVGVVVQENGKKKLVTDYDLLNADIINPVLAEQLRKCWKSFGEGLGATPFDRDSGGVRNVCAVCSQFVFKESMVYTKDMLFKYLTTTPMPLSDQHYFSYLNLQQTNAYGEQIDSLPLFVQNFEVNQQYYIFLKHFVVSVGQAKSGMKDIYYLMIVDHQQLKENSAGCMQLYG